MNDVTEPLRKIERTYVRLSPFVAGEPEKTFKEKYYNDGEIGGYNCKYILFEGCTFKKIRFEEINNCKFVNCNFSFNNWESHINFSHFVNCIFEFEDFTGTTISHSDFRNCTIRKSSFSVRTVINNIYLQSIDGMETCWGLHNVSVQTGSNHIAQTEPDHQVGALNLPRITQWASWSRLRAFGKLPFFGVSYSGLVGIPTFLFLISIYNQQIIRFQNFSNQLRNHSEQVVFNLHQIAIPPLSLTLLFSFVLLAIASTTYAIFCPSRVKEFSYERWVDEFQRSAINYVPLGWQNPHARAVCALCYPLGALGVAGVLLHKRPFRN